MTLHQIRCFIAVAETLSFTKASENIFITQSALSRQITSLEQELGFLLLDRTTKYVRLTPAGTVFLEKCLTGLKVLDSAISEAEKTSQGIQGEIRIGWLTSMNSSLFFVNQIRRFQHEFPKVSIKLDCMNFSQLNTALEKGKLDLIYAMSFHLQDCSDVVYNHVRLGTLMILLNKNHPLANKELVTFQDLAGETFVTPEGSKNESPDSVLNMATHAAGINLKRTIVPTLESVYLHVELGWGVALIDDHLRAIDDDRFVCKKLSDEWLPAGPTSVMIWKRTNLNPSIPLFTNFLCNYDLSKSEGSQAYSPFAI